MEQTDSFKAGTPFEGWPSDLVPPDALLPSQPQEQDSGGERKEAMCTRTTFFVNVDWRMGATLATATNIVGQMYVECLEPVERRYPHPIVLIHGDFHTGQTTKPDGQPGWASFFLDKGFPVYIVDLPPSGRSNFLTKSHHVHRDVGTNSHSLTAAMVEAELTAPGKPRAPNVPLRCERSASHDKWPGTGQRGDPIFARYCASLATLHLNKVERQSLAQNALQALLHHIGRSILVGEGAGGNMAWLATDVEPDLVAGVIAVEPAGPPFGTACPKERNPYRLYSQFIHREQGTRIYGLTEIPLTYDPPTHPHEGFDPPAREPLDIVRVAQPGTRGSCFMQRNPDDPADLTQEVPPSPTKVRQLVNLKKVPHAIVTAHASSHIMYDWATAAFMMQAGVQCEWLRLDNKNIFGNGHLMFLETNSDEIAQVLLEWIFEKTLPHCFSDVVSSPITPPESSVVTNSVKKVQPRKQHSVDSYSSQLSGHETQYMGSQSTDEETNQSQALATPRLPSSQESEHCKYGSPGPGSFENTNKRAALSSGQTTVSLDDRTSSSQSPSSEIRIKKRPRLLSSEPTSSAAVSFPSLPSLTQSLTKQQNAHDHEAAQRPDGTSAGEDSAPGAALMRPPHPGGGPPHSRQQANTDFRSPLESPTIGHDSQLQAPKSHYSRPGNLYEHLPISQQISSMQRDNQRSFSYNNTHTTARFERPAGTAEESIAAIAMYNQSRSGSGLAFPNSMVEHQRRSPMPQHQQQNPHPSQLGQSPTTNTRGGLQPTSASTPAGEMVLTGFDPHTPLLLSSSLGSHGQSPLNGVSQMTPPSPCPAPRSSSDSRLDNLGTGSPAMPASGHLAPK
ncbi:hypothetical protein F66182_6729 [Fusarium sp. NRRL 66182]|nr:hypothetical protein F66182_6729 [Fusarium sp. NRRL 66182]